MPSHSHSEQGAHRPSLREAARFLETVSVLEDEVDGSLLLDQSHPELVEYRNFQAKRLHRSLQLLDPSLRTGEPLRILELGAMPYYFTAMLTHYYPHCEVIGINMGQGLFPGKAASPERPRQVRLQCGAPPREVEFKVHVLNVEFDEFPFPADHFDLVLCMEIIEHLIYSPTHMLAQSHRVLKPEGSFFITTPNAVDMKRTMAILLNRSAGFPYSGYSVYGRHNREFTRGELELLVEACGFKVESSRVENLHYREHYSKIRQSLFALLNWITSLPLPYLRDKREYLLLLAKKAGPMAYAYPEQLYLYRDLYPDGGGKND